MLKTFKCGNIRAESPWGRSESPYHVYGVHLSESTLGQQVSWLVPTLKAISQLNQDKGISILNVRVCIVDLMEFIS